MRELITTEDVAKILRLSNVTVRKMVSDGRIPHFKVGRSVRFDPSVLERWLMKQRRGAAAKTASSGTSQQTVQGERDDR